MSSQYSTYQAGILQSQSFRALSNFMSQELSRFDLSLPEWKVLGYLNESEYVTASEISSLLGVKRPIGSRLLKTLEAKKLIKRRTHSTDNRVTQVSITVAGKELFGSSERLIRQSMKVFLSDVDQADLNVYIKVLIQIAAKL